MLLGKLFTHEDGAYLHAHKVVGALVLAHFGWRAWLLATTGSSGLDGGVASAACIALHALLHATSFQFRLDRRRNHMYNIIWPEMRWHTAIFAMRSVAALAVMWLASDHGDPRPFSRLLEEATDVLSGGASWPLAWVWAAAAAAGLDRVLPRPSDLEVYIPAARAAIVMLTMLAADLTTALLGSKDTTMRGNPFPEETPKIVRRAVNCFYSISQVGGTLIVLCSTDMAPVLFVMLPIQVAPLLMTLVRKGFVRQGGWHVWYSLSILAAYAACIATSVKPGYVSILTWPQTVALTLAFGVARFAMRLNKYGLWAAVALVIFWPSALPMALRI